MNKYIDFCCSFCGKGNGEVKHVIIGPQVNICNECVEVCIDIIKELDAKKVPKNKFRKYR